jgi:hypothetical protein
VKDSPSAPGSTPAIVNDRRLWWLSALALVSLFIFQFGYEKAFPAASLDLSKSRADIQAIAAVWAAKVGYHPDNVYNLPEIVSTTFTEKADDKAFLEQELGQEKANQLLRQTVPVWLWKSRFCREHQFEQCYISMTPAGEFNGFIHEYRNDFALKSISRDEAEKLARDFLTNVVGVSIGEEANSKYVLIRDETKAQINRQDYIFVWEDQSLSLKGAYLDIEIHVSGDKVTFMDRYLHVPQDWLRKYTAMRSYNEQLFNVALFCWFALLTVAVFVFLFATTHHKIRWRFTILSAVAFLATILADMLNSTETAIFTYSCQVEFQTFLMQYWMGCLTSALVWFVAAIVVIGSAEFLYRNYFPEKVAAEKWFTLGGLRHPEVLKNLVTGHLGACVYIGWIIVYYIMGQRIGFWTPLQVQEAGVYSGWVPAIGAMHVGVLASSHEELLYRVIAFITISMVLRRFVFFKDKGVLVFWIANFAQAACWGFMHSSYPQQPAYARGVELVFNGMLFGWLTQSIGLLSCLVAHYLVDVLLVLRPLLGSGQIVWIIPAMFVCVPFLLMILLSLTLRNKQRGATDVLTNEHLTLNIAPVSKVLDGTTVPFQHIKLSSGSRLILFVLSLACIAGTIVFRHGNMIGEPAKLRVNREQAIAAARHSVSMRRLDVPNYLVSAQVVSSFATPLAQYQMQYLFEYTNAIKAAQLAEIAKFGYVWNVRFFKPGNSREFVVHLDGHGHEIGFDCLDIETAPGARLDLTTAKEITRRYIEQQAPDLMPISFASVSTFKRANRTDYQLGYIAPNLKVGDAPFKITIDVVGDQASGFTGAWLVPDRWRDERERKAFVDQLAAISHVLWPILAGGFAAFWAIGLLRSGVLRWRMPIIAGLTMGMITLIGFFNALPYVLQFMPTTMSTERYVLDQLLIQLRLAGIEAVKNIVLAVLAFASFRLMWTGLDVVSICQLTFCRQIDPVRREQQKQLWIDGVLVAYWVATTRCMIFTIALSLALLVSPNVCEAGLPLILPNLNEGVPGLTMLIEQITKAWSEVVSAAIFAGLYLKYARNFPAFVLLLVVGSLIFCVDGQYVNLVDYVIGVSRDVILGLLFYAFIAKLAKRNILAYLLSGIFVAALWKLPLLFLHAPRVGAFEIAAGLLGLLLPLVALGYFGLPRRGKSEIL